MQDRAKGEHVERPKNGASGTVCGRGRARKPTHRRPSASCRGIVHARADLRRLRHQFGRRPCSLRACGIWARSLRSCTLGLAIDRIGPERSLALHYACARAEAAGRSASGGWVASLHRCWAGNCWRSAYRRRIFLSACVFALIAATATALLAFRGSRILVSPAPRRLASCQRVTPSPRPPHPRRTRPALPAWRTPG